MARGEGAQKAAWDMQRYTQKTKPAVHQIHLSHLHKGDPKLVGSNTT